MTDLGDPEQRIRAALAIRDAMRVDEAPSVRALLADEVATVRFAAAEVLGVLFAYLGEDDPPDCAETVQALIGRLADTDSEVAEAAAIALGRIGGRPEAVVPLAGAAGRTDIGRAALAALLQQGEAALQATGTLETQVRRGGDLAGPAAVALTAMGPGALPILARLLGDDLAVRPILEGLHLHGRATAHLIPELSRFLWGADGVYAARLLLTLGGDAIGPLSEALDRGTPAVRRAILEGLVVPRPELVGLLAQGLYDPSGAHRALAVADIAAWGEEAAFLLPELASLADDPDPQVQAALRAIRPAGD